MRPPTITLLLAIALSTGCATVAPRQDVPDERPIAAGASAARAVALCTTRVDELERRLGTPSRDGRLGRTRVVTWIVDWEPLVRYLGVLVDAGGTVVDVVWDLPSEIAWTPVDRCTR